MIGYYIHHHGAGHLRRAVAIADALHTQVTGLSSLPRPAGWRRGWLQLDRDDAHSAAAIDATAGGSLHWAPVHDDGLRSRMSAISAWIGSAHPAAMVVDVSVEVALLARLHGVPVITIALPGERGDLPHGTGYDISDLLIGAWPTGAGALKGGLTGGLTECARSKLVTVGAISAFPVQQARTAPLSADHRRRRVVFLSGRGGHSISRHELLRARHDTPAWEWQILGTDAGSWVADPWPHLLAADVVITAAGESAIADIAASRRPAIVVPQHRPFDEQKATASALESLGMPVMIREQFPTEGWTALLDEAAALPGASWSGWNDGLGAARAAAAIEQVAVRTPRESAA
jgi:hypothetical protein